jgi:NIMA (never in mitosis gene a)-related kinase
MDDLGELDKVTNEAKQLRKLQHRNIVAYHDEFLHEDSRTLSGNKYKFLLVMEFCQNGDLLSKINKWREDKKLPSEAEVMGILIDILEAVKYIHARDIIHRDIKSENIFIATDLTAKLGDFGLCAQGKSIKTRKSGKYSMAVGTENYHAPELFRGSLFQKGKASDVWALGCVLLEMVLAMPIWDIDFRGSQLGIRCIEDANYAKDFVMHNVSDKYDPALRSLLKKMLASDPKQRPTVEEILKKKFVRNWFNRTR